MRRGAAFESARTDRVFFNEREFAERVLWQPRSGAPKEIVGVFEERFRADDLVEAEIENSEPRLRCASEGLPDVREGDGITIPAEDDGSAAGRKLWIVRGVEPDSKGHTFLVLSEV